MCEEHAAAGIPCPSMESIGSAILAAPRAIAGITLGVCAAVALSFVLANLIWFGLGLAAAVAVAGTVLVRKIRRNLRDGREMWHPGLATTPARVNGARRPAVEAPQRAALPPSRPGLPVTQAQQLAELGQAIWDVRYAPEQQAITDRRTSS